MYDLMPTTSSVHSSRILYTPSNFARTSLLHLQEVGTLKAIHPHTSTRNDLNSFLCFVVLFGKGRLVYEGITYDLEKGDCVFIDCRKAYSHSTFDELWSLRWCHFYSPSVVAIYKKYKERGGQPVFHPESVQPFDAIMKSLYNTASSSDYIRDMRINESLSTLLTLLMEQSWHPEASAQSKKRMELSVIKCYIDEHYTEKISMDDLAARFYINKQYLMRIFKKTYGTTINNYILDLRITKAKQCLRFTTMSIEEVGDIVGVHDVNYFSRCFRKIEGISPSEYRRQW